ncbi:MAG: ABC transporter permease subunit [Actinomycetales bacterium]|nr:ABC transporter permease subunit [Actinomycetales bacterium]
MRARLLLLPAVVPVVVVLGATLALGGAQSLGLMPVVGEPALNLRAYRAVVASGDLWPAITVSVTVAGAATALALAVGLATALAVRASRVGGRILGALAASTIPIPHVVGAAAIGLLLADTGWLPRLLGLDEGAWPALVAGPWWGAVVLEYAWKESAFVALVVLASLAADTGELMDTAAVLGAGRWARARHILLPLALPGLVTAGAISFIYAVGSFEVPWLLGRSSPEPLSVLAYRLFTSTDLTVRPQALAVAVVTVALSAAIGLAALGLLRRRPVLA